jgi:hypothetical protein
MYFYKYIKYCIPGQQALRPGLRKNADNGENLPVNYVEIAQKARKL